MKKRTEKALEILKSGGRWVHKLERHFLGGEKFKHRLINYERVVQEGFGAATFFEMEHLNLLKQDFSVTPTSVWRSEYFLNQGEK